MHSLGFNNTCSLPSPKQALISMCLLHNCFENTVEKGEIACKKQFSPFPSFFYPFLELFAIFIKTEIDCKLFQLGKGQVYYQRTLVQKFRCLTEIL